MAKVEIEILYTYFETGDKPTETQFRNLIDSFWHKDSSISLGNITGLQDALNAKANEASLNTHIANNVAHVTQAEKDVWNSSVSSDTFNAHVADDVAHVTQANRDIWDSKADGNHIHEEYETLFDGLAESKADNTHVHIGELIVAPTGQSGEANSIRLRPDGSDAVLEMTADGTNWTELKRWIL